MMLGSRVCLLLKASLDLSEFERGRSELVYDNDNKKKKKKKKKKRKKKKREKKKRKRKKKKKKYSN